ncbi:WXG100 family type VII secretion target [Streptomyces cyaneus]|uniref:WXG100 family type VII secretion target n=1 Tax=Streptomyces cyaneus TaxID=1904 RepID=UPI000FF8AD0D|nr:WXG100 family type VII secretion target [Streptomyces cyaneus]
MGYGYGGYYNSPEYYEAQQKAQQQRIQDKHDQRLESTKDGGMGGPDRSKLDSDFMKMSIPELRSMILDADPGRIYEVSQHWKSVHNILSGGDGDGKTGGVDSVSAKDSVAGMMQSAIENVLEHWEGEAAEAFRKKANEIMQNIRNGSAWANHYGETMHAVQNDLRNSMTQMREVEEPSGWDRAWDKLTDDERSDEQLLADINKGVSTEAAAKANADSLSAGKEAQLKGVAIMEQLGVNYKAYSSGNLRETDPKDPFQPPNPQTPMPPPIPVPSGGGSSPSRGGTTAKPWSAGPTTNIKPTPTVPRDPGITGGSQLPTAGTKVDSISPGLTGTGPSTGVGGPGAGGGNFGTSGAQGSGIVAPGGASGLAGGAAARGGIGAVGGRGGLTGGGAAAGRGAGGRSGMGGMGGAGAGAAGRGGAGAGGRGALAKSRGGVVGAAKGVTGKGAGGGAGLHGSRGGSQRGAMAGGAGGMAGRNGRRSEDENSRGDRPDYLVEDEETWISEEDRNRNVPRTIE